MCGEKKKPRAPGDLTIGSPPRVRGKGSSATEGNAELRITPACAGKSCKARLSTTDVWDHPRVCGEKQAKLAWEEIAKGSPPRVRGKGLIWFHNGICRGITPACAGKSRTPVYGQGLQGDHPRVCGEKVLDFFSGYTFEGSPPRVRGKDVVEYHSHIVPRITPACAGKSQPTHATIANPLDHPRVCGEKVRYASGA